MSISFASYSTRQGESTGSASMSRSVFAWPLLAVISFLPPVMLFTGLALQSVVPVAELLRDPLAVAQQVSDCCESHYGFVSNMGAMIWFAGAAVCLFAAACLAVLGGRLRKVCFFAVAGLFTGLLGADDLFLLHDHVLPAVGVPQMAIYGLYGLFALGFLGLCLREIFAHSGWLFLTAGFLLAGSIAIDQAIESEASWRILLEDGLKFAGLWSWVVYFTARALAAVTGSDQLVRD